LTRREAEVLRWLTHGKTNPQIGAKLHISPRTVEIYLTRIMMKLKVPTRTAAATQACALLWHAQPRDLSRPEPLLV
jgi:DNA-binding NarL/FixJ family response regulator